MSQNVARDRPSRLVVAVGVAILGLAIAVAVFIEYLATAQAGGLRLPDDVPRAVAIPALYATVGFLAIVGAQQGRPHIVLTSGVLCLIGAFLSFATVLFAVPGLLLVNLASARNNRSEALVAAGVAVLVVGAAVALLGTTEGRCWEAHGSPSSPTYTVIPCTDQPVTVGGGDTFGSGYDGGVLTTRGAVFEAVLLLVAITLAAGTGRRSTSGETRPGDPAGVVDLI
jgi:hypothetical protein